jgi:hypothetical protein
VVFADVVDELIDALNRTPSYLVKEVGLDSGGGGRRQATGRSTAAADEPAVGGRDRRRPTS